MKWSIEGFQQIPMVAAGMDAADAVILRWLVDIIGTGKIVYREIDGKVYYWIRYEALLGDLPILRITDLSALRKRLRATAPPT